jgi:CRISPR/Cas system CMR-associated protein Cmr5 small subunit
MSKAIKSKIYQMLEGIEDVIVLNQVMEDVAFYASKKDIIDELSPEQINELDKSIEEAKNKETISWDDFKREINE